MPFKPPVEKPQFADLIVSLDNSRSQTKDNAFYQTVYLLLQRLTKFRNLVINDINGLATASDSFKNATYLTQDDETIALPNSRKVIRTLGIGFDDSVPGERIVTLTHYWTPLTDGDVDQTDIIYANGEAIAVEVPIIAPFP